MRRKHLAPVTEATAGALYRDGSAVHNEVGHGVARRIQPQHHGFVGAFLLGSLCMVQKFSRLGTAAKLDAAAKLGEIWFKNRQSYTR